MELVFILVFGSIVNYSKARAAGLNAALWSFITAIAIVISFILGTFMVGIIMMVKDPNLSKLIVQHQGDQKFMLDYVMKNHNIIVIQIFLFVCAIGGYLFTNYLIKKKARPVE